MGFVFKATFKCTELGKKKETNPQCLRIQQPFSMYFGSIFFLRTMFSTTYLLLFGGWMGNKDHMFFPKNHQNQPFTGLAGATWPMVQLRSTQLLRT